MRDPPPVRPHAVAVAFVPTVMFTRTTAGIVHACVPPRSPLHCHEAFPGGARRGTQPAGIEALDRSGERRGSKDIFSHVLGFVPVPFR